jgi:outer membrane receptor protein involved in Fe transport
MQRNLLDFSITKTIKKNWSVRVGVQDVLNQPIVLLQDANEDGKLSKGTDQSMQRFRRGAYWTLTLRYRFSR